MGVRAVCFIDMPFGKKTDLASGVEVDFDQIYAAAIEPAIIGSGLDPIRGDRERQRHCCRERYHAAHACPGNDGHVPPRRTGAVSYTHLTLPTICSV